MVIIKINFRNIIVKIKKTVFCFKKSYQSNRVYLIFGKAKFM